MTAEISLLNRNGVVLAADSAVTIGGGKVYNSASKLFTLSPNHSIGVMIFGDANFMGVPWETIIKKFNLYILKENITLILKKILILKLERKIIMISLTKNQSHFKHEKVSDDPFKKAVQLNTYNNIVKENITEQYNRYSKEKQRKEEIMGVTPTTKAYR